MADTIFELSAKLGLDSTSFEDGIDKAERQAKKSGSNIGASLKSAAITGAKAFASMATAAAAGVAALAGSAVKAYSEYEQLVGGVDTLFGEASQRLQDYANQAYKTAGMSANEYMANATDFSAALISSLGGDTKLAADYANRAMVSMSDNANKMGTSLDSIVQTYQSLSRGNMAMLDNLKLGYGGTKEELKRLIEDAASYTEIQKEMGIEVDRGSTSFANIVNAIAVVQKKLGIAGATSAEAATTIEGSLNSAKASWKNLVTAMADDTQNFDDLMNRFVETLVGDGSGQGGFINNILPRFAQALNGVSKLIERIAPLLVQKLPKIIEDVFPTLLSAAGQIIERLIVALPDLIKGTLPTFIDAIGDIVGTILDALPAFVDAVAKVLPTVVEQIGRLFTEKNLVSRFVKAIVGVIQAITNNIGPILEAITAVLPGIIESILMGIVENLPALMNSLTELIGQIIKTVFDVIMNPDVFSTMLDGIGRVVAELIKHIPELLLEPLKILFEDIMDTIEKAFKAIWTGDFSAYQSDKPEFSGGSRSFSGGSFDSTVGDYSGSSALEVIVPQSASVGDVTIVIEGNAEDPEAVGRAVAEELQNMMNRRGAASAAY